MFPDPFYGMLRDLTRLRGALTPWVYTLAWKTHVTAVPFMRPMWWDSADVPDAWSMPQQYMFGPLVVCPVTDLTLDHAVVETWLPSLPPSSLAWMKWDGLGQWRANVHVSLAVPVDTTPVFVPDGTVLPMWPPGVRHAPVAERAVMWTAWVSGHGTRAFTDSQTLYEDDGDTLDYIGPAGAWATTQTVLDVTDGGAVTLTVSPPTRTLSGQPAVRTHLVQLRGGNTSDITQVACTIDAHTIPLVLGTEGDFVSTGRWWRMDASGDQAELSCPGFAVVAVCPPAPLHALVAVKFSA